MTVDLSAVRGIKGCGLRPDTGPLRETHDIALYHASDCPACLSLLVAGIRREAFEEAVAVADACTCAAPNPVWSGCQRAIASRIGALAGGKEEG